MYRFNGCQKYEREFGWFLWQYKSRILRLEVNTCNRTMHELSLVILRGLFPDICSFCWVTKLKHEHNLETLSVSHSFSNYSGPVSPVSPTLNYPPPPPTPHLMDLIYRESVKPRVYNYEYSLYNTLWFESEWIMQKKIIMTHDIVWSACQCMNNWKAMLTL